MVSQELLIELKQILKEDFGLDLPMETVTSIAGVFISYFDLMAKINCQK